MTPVDIYYSRAKAATRFFLFALICGVCLAIYMLLFSAVKLLVIGVIFGVLSLWPLWRAAGPAKKLLSIDDEGIRVYATFSATFWPWSEVAHAEMVKSAEDANEQLIIIRSSVAGREPLTIEESNLPGTAAQMMEILRAYMGEDSKPAVQRIEIQEIRHDVN